jgi:hypothetical protein
VSFSDTPSYTGSCVATGRASGARQVSVEKPDEGATRQSPGFAERWA